MKKSGRLLALLVFGITAFAQTGWKAGAAKAVVTPREPIWMAGCRRAGLFWIERDGERGRNRTYNLLIKSQLLCQLSYAPTTLRHFLL